MTTWCTDYPTEEDTEFYDFIWEYDDALDAFTEASMEYDDRYATGSAREVRYLQRCLDRARDRMDKYDPAVWGLGSLASHMEASGIPLPEWCEAENTSIAAELCATYSNTEYMCHELNTRYSADIVMPQCVSDTRRCIEDMRNFFGI